MNTDFKVENFMLAIDENIFHNDRSSGRILTALSLLSVLKYQISDGIALFSEDVETLKRELTSTSSIFKNNFIILNSLHDKDEINALINKLRLLDPATYKLVLVYKDRCDFGVSSQVFEMGDLVRKPLHKLEFKKEYDPEGDCLVRDNILRFGRSIDLISLANSEYTLVDHTKNIRKITLDALCVTMIPRLANGVSVNEHTKLITIPITDTIWTQDDHILTGEVDVIVSGDSYRIMIEVNKLTGKIVATCGCNVPLTQPLYTTKPIIVGYTVSVWV